MLCMQGPHYRASNPFNMFNLPKSKPKVQAEFLKTEFYLPFQSSNLKFCIRMTSHEKFKIVWIIIYIKKKYIYIYIPYARHYNPRFVYFLSIFRSSFMYCDLWPYVWLINQSGFKSRAAYGGARTVSRM